MSESKFSKGPWRVEHSNGNTQIRDAAGNSLMCDEQYYPWTPDKAEDWNLISAAPDMYEVICDIVFDCNGLIQPGLYELAVKALAKAEGR